VGILDIDEQIEVLMSEDNDERLEEIVCLFAKSKKLRRLAITIISAYVKAKNEKEIADLATPFKLFASICYLLGYNQAQEDIINQEIK